MPFSNTARAAAALTVGVAAIAWSAMFVRWTHIPGVASAFYRMLLASAILWLFSLRRSTTRTRWTRRNLLYAAIAGICFAGDVGCYNVAVLRTGAGSATFLGNNAPLVVGLLTWIVTRKRPHARFWISFAVALAGAWLIVSADLHAFRAGLSGDLLAATASVCFALFLFVTGTLRDTLDTYALVMLSSAASALTLLLFALATRTSLAIPSLTTAAALAGLALICQLAGYFSLTYALGHLQTTVTSVVMLAVAPVTALLSYLFFGEPTTPPQMLGGLLILVAVWIVTSGTTAKPAPTPPEPDFL